MFTLDFQRCPKMSFRNYFRTVGFKSTLNILFRNASKNRLTVRAERVNTELPDVHCLTLASAFPES